MFSFFKNNIIKHSFFGELLYQKDYWENIHQIKFGNDAIDFSIDAIKKEIIQENQILFFKFIENIYEKEIKPFLEIEILNYDYMYYENKNHISFKISSISIPIIEKWNISNPNIDDLIWEVCFDIFCKTKNGEIQELCNFFFTMKGKKYDFFMVDGY